MIIKKSLYFILILILITLTSCKKTSIDKEPYYKRFELIEKDELKIVVEGSLYDYRLLKIYK